MRSAKWKARSKTRSLANSLMDGKCWSGWEFVAMISIQYPSSSRSNCLLKPPNGNVSRASGQVLGTLASVWRVVIVHPPVVGQGHHHSCCQPDSCQNPGHPPPPSIFQIQRKPPRICPDQMHQRNHPHC